MSNYFDEQTLLRAPTERAAFSDRQAYVCAEMSRLAYFRFEGGHAIDDILDVAKEIFGEGDKFELLENQIRTMLAGSREAELESKKVFETILKTAGFDLIDTYNAQGTQAFMCKRVIERQPLPEKSVVYLAFRGTEPKEFQDIRTDIRARLKEVTAPGEKEKIEVHTGYYDALDLVAKPILKDLEEQTHEQLIVCGHSLGGALGIVFTRLYASGVNGACYTFGAPPVGAANVQNRLKTPVYEIVNELDIVPNLPNPWLGWFTSFLLRLFWLLAKSVTWLNKVLTSGNLDEKLEHFIEMMTRYRHPGYMSYLVGVKQEARLRYNLSSFDKVKLWLRMIGHKGFSKFGKLVHDHSISLYVEKLKNHALIRNQRASLDGEELEAAGESE